MLIVELPDPHRTLRLRLGLVRRHLPTSAPTLLLLPAVVKRFFLVLSGDTLPISDLGWRVVAVPSPYYATN